MIGLLILMPLSDNKGNTIYILYIKKYILFIKGRKYAIGISWLLITIGILLCSIFDNIYLVLLGLFITGIGATPI